MGEGGRAGEEHRDAPRLPELVVPPSSQHGAFGRLRLTIEQWACWAREAQA